MMRQYPTRDEIIQQEDDKNWPKEVTKEQPMSDTLPEREDEMSVKDSRMIGEWCNDCHGYVHAPWCPSYKEPAKEVHEQWCQCTHAKYNHGEDDFSSQDCRVSGCDCNSFTLASKHEPAARGGGDGPERIWLQPGQALDPAECTLSHIGTERVTDNDIEYVRMDQHQALVAERERLREVLSECRDDLSAAIDRLPPRLSDHADMIHCKELLARINAVLNNEQRSTSE